jgi:CRP-like cAMP-binding protein
MDAERNTILRFLSAHDRDALALEPVALPARARLEEAGRKIPYLYFPLSGVAAILFNGKGDAQAEIAVFGREGCSGCSLILGSDQTPQLTMMLLPGEALRTKFDVLQRALDERPALRRLLNFYVHTMIIQRDETAVSAARGNVHQRLARALLMIADRGDEKTVPLTHDVLSAMLGVRRAGVTNALGWMKARNLIDRGGRGYVHILDRAGLTAVCSDFYGAQEKEFSRLYASAGKEPAA